MKFHELERIIKENSANNIVFKLYDKKDEEIFFVSKLRLYSTKNLNFESSIYNFVNFIGYEKIESTVDEREIISLTLEYGRNIK